MEEKKNIRPLSHSTLSLGTCGYDAYMFLQESLVVSIPLSLSDCLLQPLLPREEAVILFLPPADALLLP